MTTMKRLIALGLVLAVWAIVAGPASAGGGYTITDLGTLGGTYSNATAISPNGTIVGRASLSGSFPWHAFRYSGGTMTDLGTLGGPSSEASDVNDAGEIVGTAETGSGLERAFLVGGGPMVDLGTLGGPWSFGWGINAAGVVVGDADAPNFVRQVFRYSGGTMVDLGALDGGSAASAQAINDGGTVVGYSRTASGCCHAFVSGLSALIDLGTFGGTSSVASDVNTTGDILINVSTAPGIQHAVIYSGGVATNLGTLGGNYSIGNAINNLGQVIGNADVAGAFHSFLYSSGQMVDLKTLLLDNSGWASLDFANDINDAGQIVGLGVHNGLTHAFVLTPNTASGANVVVQPIDHAGSSPVTLTFSNVTQPGGTTLTTSASGPVPPVGFDLGDPPMYYELATSASFTGPIEVCIDSTGISFSGPPTLWHYEGGAWVNVTTSVNGAIVCGSVTSLSPFALFAAPAAPTYHVCLLYDPDKAVKAGSTIPIKLRLCDADGANLSSPAIVLHAQGVKLVSTDAPGPLADSGNANPDSNFRYDAALGGTGGYIYNLSTKGLATGTYALEFTAGGDSHVYQAEFQVR
jgi:probable HAF family extracellular repeat protein